jgi:uncharacterized RDD family membrane protein YckC
LTYIQPDAAPYGRASGPRAGFWRRFAAALIDGILVGIVYAILVALLKGAGVAIGILGAIAYFTYLEGGERGQTFGKSAMNIRVISLADGRPIGYGRAAIRYFGRIVSTIPIYLGYFWMLWDREHQTWHDKFAGSVVVPVSAYPLP